MLRNYGKSFSAEQVALASLLCAKLDMNHCHYLLFGGPGESEETIEETYRLAQDWKPDMANWNMYTPWPFSDLFQELGVSGGRRKNVGGTSQIFAVNWSEVQ